MSGSRSLSSASLRVPKKKDLVISSRDVQYELTKFTCAAHLYGHFLTKEAFTKCVTGHSGRKSGRNM